MAAVTQSYPNPMLSDTLPTPGFFTAAIAADESLNIFENSFKETASAANQSRYSDQDVADNQFLRTYADEVFSPLFGLSPRVQSPLPPSLISKSDPDAQSQTVDALKPPVWAGPDQNKQPQLGELSALSQQPSPPRSSRSPADSDSQKDSTQSLLSSSLDKILTHHNTTGTRAQHGQVTPPDDHSPNPLVGKDEGSCHSPAQPIPAQLPTTSTTTSKRKRSGQASQPAAANDDQPSKRQRKSSVRSKSAGEDVETTGDAEGDAKRSRFLERNRVAASKCRQKKKEWTNNLENRARELQNSKNQLTLIVSSLKDEVLYLKGELLKHTSCNCTRIRDYLNHEVTNLSHRPSYSSRITSLGMPMSVASSPQLSAGATSRSGSISFYPIESSPVAVPALSTAGSVSPLSASPMIPQLKADPELV